MSDCLRKGYLLKCPQKARAFKKWNSRWFVLYGNSPRGRVRLEYYDNERAWQQERGKRIIPLVHCVSIKPVWNKEYNHVLEIVTSDKTFYLGAGSKEEEKSWFKSLCKIVFGNANRNSIVQVLSRPEVMDMGYHSLDRGTEEDSNLSRSQSTSLTQSSPQLSKIMGSKEKLGHDSTGFSDLNVTGSSTETRNVLSPLSSELSSLISFESGFDDLGSVASSIAESTVNKYYVTVRPTIASQEAGMAGQYILQITPLTLILKEMGTENPVAEWPIQHLRRYGRGRTKFSFEAGDKCKTGIGVYTFNTREGDQIFHTVDMHARKLSNQTQMHTANKRMLMNSQSFKPLSETRRRAKSEGRLLESSDDSTINELSESMESVTKQFKVADNTSFPSRTVLQTLDVIEDKETAERKGDGSVIMRPRSKTDVSMIKDRPFQMQEQNLTGESTESLLKNPANSEFDSVETVKGQDEGVGESIEEGGNVAQNGDVNKVESEVKTTELMNDETKVTAANKSAESREEENTEHIIVTSNLERMHTESPFEPLSTSEAAAQINQVIDDDTTDFTNGIEANDTAYETIRDAGRQTAENAEKELAMNAVKEAPEEKVVVGQANKPGIELFRVKSLEAEKGNVTSEIVDVPKKRKSRRLAQRNKSFEFGSPSEKTVDNKKHSGSFSSFDYRKYRENNEPIYKGDNAKRLQRFASVKRTVEMYEKITTAANEARQKSFTLWKRKSFRSSQKPEAAKRTTDSNT